MKKLLLVSSLVAAVVARAELITYTGSNGMKNWRTFLNNQMDGDDPSKYLWSDNLAAHPGGDYAIGGLDTVFYISSPMRFGGDSLEVKSNAMSLYMNGEGFEAAKLTIDKSATLDLRTDWDYSRVIRGDIWEVDGTLTLSHLKKGGHTELAVPLSGVGLIKFAGWANGWSDAGAANQVISSDNSAFKGRFLVTLPNTVGKDETYARGVSISTASALGGVPDQFLADALKLSQFNGLVATETLTLETVNRGITLDPDAFFQVAADKVLTIREPIVSVGGFFKRGLGALALDSTVTFGADGTASPDGTNNRLLVKEGALRCVSTTATKDLSIVFATGSGLEIDPTTGTKGLVCRALSFEGILPVTVDFDSSYTPGETETVVLLTVPEAVAQTLAGRVDARAKGSPMIGKISMSAPLEGLVAISATLTVPGREKIVTLCTNGADYGSQLNGKTDSKGNDLWSDHLAAHDDGDYSIPYGKYYQFQLNTPTKFKGDSLEMKNGANVDIEVPGGAAEITSLYVGQGVLLVFYHTWTDTRTLTGDAWTIDGTVRVAPSPDHTRTSRFNLSAPLSGSGEVHFKGWQRTAEANGAANHGIFADNSAFRGKFTVSLPSTDETHARGIEIAQASALGGVLAEPTPDALVLASWNGLVATETLTLDTENRGIDLKANAFFDVASGKTMTIAEPIRSEGGFFKRGAGTLAFGASDVTFGADGTAAADGVNNAFRVAAGAVRPTGKLGLSKLSVTFAADAALEIDAFETDPEVAADGFYQPSGWTVESGKLQVNVVFPSGYDLEQDKVVVLATVPQESAQALAGNMVVNLVGLAHRRSAKVSVEPAGDGLAKIVLTAFRSGLIVIVK